ncbi:hypothetical protein GCM10010885_17680 [Alicyclobacillus cellulosilyticus]|uniref:Uncharacterized protein n=1 Tax=Alicyclobacillus cellulosilyticus TaxID=1003997 RepID=A0A917NKY4_9BACL|nr:hypothetical protein GCM10010885_17680 [Alicyclobacillus cellulosilyticus]
MPAMLRAQAKKAATRVATARMAAKHNGFRGETAAARGVMKRMARHREVAAPRARSIRPRRGWMAWRIRAITRCARWLGMVVRARLRA